MKIEFGLYSGSIIFLPQRPYRWIKDINLLWKIMRKRCL